MTQETVTFDAMTIAQQWLDASAFTATNKQFDAHFNLISKRVRVTGVAGFESVSYDDWARQSKQEFEDNILKSVSYAGLKLLATNDYQIMFKTVESIVANDGLRKAQGVEIMLEREEDGVWRVKQERVLSEDEARHDGLI
jgi:hypothetical protein